MPKSLPIIEDRRLTLDQAGYMPPNSDNSRKSCSNCWKYQKDKQRCLEVAGTITPLMVCNTHVFGGAITMEFTAQQTPAQFAGLIETSEGTSCDNCSAFKEGFCQRLQDGQGNNAKVEARGCCDAWTAISSMDQNDLSERLDAVADRLSGVKLPGEVRHAVEAAAEIVAKQRLTRSQRRAMQRAAKKHLHKHKVWVEVTDQPKKGRHGVWLGRATFYWKGDPDKTKHSQVITPGGPARLTIKSMKLFVKPRDGEGYFYGVKRDEAGSEKSSDEAQKKDEQKNPEPEKKKEHGALDPTADDDGDGVADAARVGVPAKEIPPPPPTPRLPNLTEEQRAIEQRFIEDYEKDPEGMGDRYRLKVVGKAAKKNEPPTFVTDDAKMLSADYDPPGKSPEEIGAARARRNVLVHQAANAIAKRAFVQHLDELAKLPDGDKKKSVLVTSGGCGAGKGFAVKKGPGAVKELKDQVGAIWDAAGEQNATENPWILEECKKRGLKAHFLFVDADPERQWASPKLGVVSRAAQPPPEGEGRMVDARLFADSYALGAKNFKAFQDGHKDDPNANFVFINTWDMSEPDDKGDRWPIIRGADGISEKSLALNSDELYRKATDVIQRAAPTEAIKEGATVGQKIWGPPAEGKKTTASARPEVVVSAGDKDEKKGKDEGLKELEETLRENFDDNMKNLDKFYREAWEDSREFVSDLEYDKNGHLKPPKTRKVKKDKDEDEGDDEKGEKTEASVDASTRMDAIVTVLTAKVKLPAETMLALEEAATAVSARVRRRRHRMLRYAEQNQAQRYNIDEHRPAVDAVNVGNRLKSLPESVQQSKDLAEALEDQSKKD